MLFTIMEDFLCDALLSKIDCGKNSRLTYLGSWLLRIVLNFDSRLIMNLIGSILGSIVLVLGNIQDFRQYSRVGRVR